VQAIQVRKNLQAVVQPVAELLLVLSPSRIVYPLNQLKSTFSNFTFAFDAMNPSRNDNLGKLRGGSFCFAE